METTEQIEIAENFILQNCELELLEQLRKGYNHLVIDFSQLMRFNTEIADLVLDQPEDMMKVFEIASQKIAGSRKPDKLFIRFRNLPSSTMIPIRTIRKDHINKLISIEGIVKQKSDVRPKTKAARFECPVCSAIIPILQLDDKYKEPERCGCGRKGKFRLVSEELVDIQWMVIEETLDSVSGDRAKKIKVFLEEDLVSPWSEKRTSPGNKILLSGILKKTSIELKTGAKSTSYDYMIEANHIEPIEELFEELNITPADEIKIKELSSKPTTFGKMVDALLPNVFGYDMIKQALVLQAFGGVRKERPDDSDLRGDIHVLLVGDPGTAKSSMLRRMCEVYPKSRYAVAASSTGVGLTGAVVKDDLLKGGYTLEAGALSLAHKGLCAIDELDKSSDEDRNKLHEGMEQQTITISKANIQERLPCQTTILAAANPEHGRFDNYDNEIEQVGKIISSTLISRFDLIFVIRDIPNEDEDKRKASFILRKHREATVNKKEETSNPFADVKFFQKYVAYSKLHCRPNMTEQTETLLLEYYTNVRKLSYGGEKFTTVAISARQLEALIRMSEARAKSRLSNSVEPSDAEFAIKVFEEYMKKIAFDKETGTFDVDMIATGTSTSTRNKFSIILDAVKTLCESHKSDAPYSEVIELLKSRGLSELESEQLIEKLHTRGDLIEHRSGYLRCM